MPDPSRHDDLADALVIFGITGDLAFKKIFPALENLERRGRLPALIIGVARGGATRETVIERMNASLAADGGSVDPQAVQRAASDLRGLVARNPDDGHVVWAYQLVPHDMHDYDEIMENILVDMPFNGHQRKLLIHPGRTGFVYTFDRTTGEVHVGRVPPYAVVVPGSLPGKPLPDGTPGPSLYCAVIVKTVDAQTRSKTGINELLRD